MFVFRDPQNSSEPDSASVHHPPVWRTVLRAGRPHPYPGLWCEAAVLQTGTRATGRGNEERRLGCACQERACVWGFLPGTLQTHRWWMEAQILHCVWGYIHRQYISASSIFLWIFHLCCISYLTFMVICINRWRGSRCWRLAKRVVHHHIQGNLQPHVCSVQYITRRQGHLHNQPVLSLQQQPPQLLQVRGSHHRQGCVW